MNTAKKYEMLDNEAESLYLELEGLDDQYYNDSDEEIVQEPEDSKKTDALKLILIEIVHLISTYIQDARFLEGIKNKKDSFEDFINAVEKLAAIPGNDRNLLVRFRGFPTGTKTPAQTDYVISFGNMTVDSAGAAAIFSRAGVSMVHLQGRIAKAFKVFSDNGISTLCLKIPAGKAEITNEYREKLRVSLNITSHYNNSLKSGTPIIFEKNGNKVFLPLALDEQGMADINLTLVAGLNSLKPQSVKAMVKKVGVWMLKPGNSGYVSVYDSISGIKSLKSRLTMPDFEINNLRWLSLDKNQTVISKKKAGISRLAAQQFQDSPQDAARVIQTVYGEDYNRVSSDQLGQRVKAASDLLSGAVAKNRDNQANKGIEKEILTNIHERFHDINDDVFDNIEIKKNVLVVHSDKQETIVGKIHSQMHRIINFHKKRAAVNRKIKNITDKNVIFNIRDYETIAKNFDVSVKNAEKLVKLLKACFDDKGHFLRKVFEKHIPVFVKFEGKIFRFMWYFLKQTPVQSDRIAFLNSLQLLIAKMKNPQNALDLLLADIMSDTGKVNLSDRNAFMLGNILVRTYNKEINVDIEVTPEEVLLVQNGLNREITKAMSEKIDSEQESFLEKAKAVHTNLMQSLESDQDENTFNPRFLLYLERELLIFLALTGGNTACSVLRSAVKRYGDPESEIYSFQNSKELIGAIIQHLTVAVRGLDRVGENQVGENRVGNEQDAELLENILKNEQEFLSLCSDSGCANKVRRLMHWAEKIHKKISKA